MNAGNVISSMFAQGVEFEIGRTPDMIQGVLGLMWVKIFSVDFLQE